MIPCDDSALKYSVPMDIEIQIAAAMSGVRVTREGKVTTQRVLTYDVEITWR